MPLHWRYDLLQRFVLVEMDLFALITFLEESLVDASIDGSVRKEAPGFALTPSLFYDSPWLCVNEARTTKEKCH